MSEFKHVEQDAPLAHPRPSILAGFLREAKLHHTAFEDRQRHADHNWENWYALFLAYRIDGIDEDVAAGWTNLDILSSGAVK